MKPRWLSSVILPQSQAEHGQAWWWRAMFLCAAFSSLDILVENLATKSVLLWDDFNDGNLTNWKAFDDAGTISGPSIWSVVNGTLVQSSNIGSDATGHPGTFLLY